MMYWDSYTKVQTAEKHFMSSREEVINDIKELGLFINQYFLI